eukprot:jgi/Tetstr1/466846/TSEL_011303.t1
MDMIRIEPEERLIDKEGVLGRDTTSVFPSESKKGMVGLDAEATKEALGAVKFVTEQELVEIKAQRGERPEDGTMTVDKTLAEILAENKEAKEEKFQEVWKSMKVGKNRPMDEDEMQFLDSVYKSETARENAKRQEEEKELAAFQLARLEAQNKDADEQVVQAAKKPAAKPAPKKEAKKPLIRAVIKPKKANGDPHSAGPSEKRQKVEAAAEEGGGGLAGLAGYGSDSDSDSD